MTDSVRNKWIGAACTVVVHVVALCILILVVIKSEPVPADAGGGVLVQFGSVDEASGMFIPDKVPESSSRQEIVSKNDEPLITQDDEPTVAIPKKKKKSTEKSPAEKQPRPDNKAIDNRLKAAFGSGVAATGSKGDAEHGSGVQGNPFGETSDGGLQGVGGYGGYSLGGRGLLGELPRPQYDSSNDAGTIVVDIVVDARGKVVDARMRVSGSEGTAASNANLRRSAVEAARKASFEAVAKAGNQQGYIVYYFKQR